MDPADRLIQWRFRNDDHESIDEAREDAVEAVVVSTDWLNLRSAPRLGSGVIDVLPYGTRATVTGLPANPTDDGYLWVGIETEDGARGWVAGMYLARV